jgi:hypothetical protein
MEKIVILPRAIHTLILRKGGDLTLVSHSVEIAKLITDAAEKVKTAA